MQTVNLDQKPDLEGLGRLIVERRQALNQTQTQLAQRLGWVQERISVLEHGKYGMPSLAALVRLAEALDVSLSALVEAAGYNTRPFPQPEAATEPAHVAPWYVLQEMLAIETNSLSDAMDQASDLLATAMGADKVDAFFHEPSSQSLIALGTSNTPMGRHQHQAGLNRVPLADGGRVVTAYQTGETIYTGEAAADSLVNAGEVNLLGVRSVIAVPLRVDGALRGVLVAEAAQPDAFSLEERKVFEAAAHWVGMVARRIELTESLTRAAADQARRLAAEEVITVLAHDLGNVLTPIKGRLDLLRRRLESEGRTLDLEHVQHMGRGITRIQRMISELLDVARLDRGIFSLAPQSVDLVTLVKEVVATLHGADTEIELRLPPEMHVHGDPERITQVLENLCYNALHHSPQATPIVVTAQSEQRDSGTWSVVSVQDAGPGIAPDVLSSLFTRFASGPKSTGLGLGLYLARSIAEAHGGTLTAESSPNVGATFRLSLPASS